MELNEIREFIKNINQDDIIFDSHFYKRIKERPIDEGIVRSFLSNINKLEKIEKGKGEKRFKLWFKMSNRYYLIVIISILSSKSLKVISAWNSNRKWQDKLKQ